MLLEIVKNCILINFAKRLMRKLFFSLKESDFLINLLAIKVKENDEDK